MKKLGFTLAEVLITLGIIGVVAALTAPALVQNAGTAKVGPTLAKVVSTIELANEQILKDEEATDLSKIAQDNDDDDDNNSATDAYYELLSKYIAGSSYETDALAATDFTPTIKYYDGTAFSGDLLSRCKAFNFADNILLAIEVSSGSNAISSTFRAKGSFKGKFASMIVDTNGATTKPNVIGKDLFIFTIDKSGQVIPMGSNTFAWLRNSDNYRYDVQNKSNALACNENYVGKGTGCAGAIFDNNLKVIYQ